MPLQYESFKLGTVDALRVDLYNRHVCPDSLLQSTKRAQAPPHNRTGNSDTGIVNLNLSLAV